MIKKKKQIEPFNLEIDLAQAHKDAIAMEAMATRVLLEEGSSNDGGEWIRDGLSIPEFRAQVIQDAKEKIKAIRSLPVSKDEKITLTFNL